MSTLTSLAYAAPTHERLLIIYTGGTIGMLPADDGLVPGEDFAERLAARPVAGCPAAGIARV